MKLVCVQGCTISHSSGSPASSGTFSIITAPSPKVKAENKGIYYGKIQINIAGGNYTGGVAKSLVSNPAIPSFLTGSAAKVKIGTQGAVLGGDTAVLSCLYVPSGSTTPVPTTINVEITDAGQSKVKGV